MGTYIEKRYDVSPGLNQPQFQRFRRRRSVLCILLGETLTIEASSSSAASVWRCHFGPFARCHKNYRDGRFVRLGLMHSVKEPSGDLHVFVPEGKHQRRPLSPALFD